jgi:endonuclease YncB( thermonuclease family)
VALAVAILVMLGVVALRVDPTNLISRSGDAVVNDGDTLTIGGERIRLRGIDAPEYDQTCGAPEATYPCGRRSAEALRVLVGDRPVACVGSSRDRYRRLLAICRVGETELNRSLVTDGWAVSFGGYQAEEDDARAGGRGLWASRFDMPQTWRRTHGSMNEIAHDGIDAFIDRLLGYLHFG